MIERFSRQALTAEMRSSGWCSTGSREQKTVPQTGEAEDVSADRKPAAATRKRMIKPWIFEFLYAPDAQGEAIAPQIATGVFDRGIALWQRIEALGFEGIFFSEHHFGLSYSPS